VLRRVDELLNLAGTEKSQLLIPILRLSDRRRPNRGGRRT
jgi:hypothetical protein